MTEYYYFYYLFGQSVIDEGGGEPGAGTNAWWFDDLENSFYIPQVY